MFRIEPLINIERFMSIKRSINIELLTFIAHAIKFERVIEIDSTRSSVTARPTGGPDSMGQRPFFVMHLGNTC